MRRFYLILFLFLFFVFTLGAIEEQSVEQLLRSVFEGQKEIANTGKTEQITKALTERFRKANINAKSFQIALNVFQNRQFMGDVDEVGELIFQMTREIDREVRRGENPYKVENSVKQKITRYEKSMDRDIPTRGKKEAGKKIKNEIQKNIENRGRGKGHQPKEPPGRNIPTGQPGQGYESSHFGPPGSVKPDSDQSDTPDNQNPPPSNNGPPDNTPQ